MQTHTHIEVLSSGYEVSVITRIELLEPLLDTHICKHNAQNTVQSDVYSKYTAVLKLVWVFLVLHTLTCTHSTHMCTQHTTHTHTHLNVECHCSAEWCKNGSHF